MRTTALAAALIAAAPPLIGQETVGTVTATINAEEFTFVVINDGDPSSGFERADGNVVVEIVAVPDRTPSERTPLLEITFAVTGMRPTAEVSDAAVSLTDANGRTLSTLGGTSEVSLTAYGIEEDEVTVAGNFASQLQDEPGGVAEAAIAGDFQASIRQPGFVTTD